MFDIDIFNKKRVRELEGEIESYRIRNCDLLIEKDRAKNRADEWQERFIEENKLNLKLAEENKKLVDWIRKILDEVGTFDTEIKDTFTIPVKRTIKEDTYDMIFPTTVVEETITIPEIVIKKSKLK